jgi:hypothetical protein
VAHYPEEDGSPMDTGAPALRGPAEKERARREEVFAGEPPLRPGALDLAGYLLSGRFPPCVSAPLLELSTGGRRPDLVRQGLVVQYLKTRFPGHGRAHHAFYMRLVADWIQGRRESLGAEERRDILLAESGCFLGLYEESVFPPFGCDRQAAGAGVCPLAEPLLDVEELARLVQPYGPPGAQAGVLRRAPALAVRLRVSLARARCTELHALVVRQGGVEGPSAWSVRNPLSFASQLRPGRVPVGPLAPVRLPAPEALVAARQSEVGFEPVVSRLGGALGGAASPGVVLLFGGEARHHRANAARVLGRAGHPKVGQVGRGRPQAGEHHLLGPPGPRVGPPEGPA